VQPTSSSCRQASHALLLSAQHPEMPSIVQPSIRETAFNCPHCSALTTQAWYQLYGMVMTGENKVPFIPTEETRAVINNKELPENKKKKLVRFVEGLLSGFVGIDETRKSEYLSQCFNCNKIAVWVHDRLLFPGAKTGAQPNPDLPPDIVADFEEAREIVNASPRGAAALLRLCIQKLCKHLGEKGKTIDDDIASLVKKGLDPLIQQSLDIVRVIGNEAVHPGTVDLRDNRATAFRLFDLVNAITARMISHPKTVKEMYAKLPKGKRDAIEARDKK